MKKLIMVFFSLWICTVQTDTPVLYSGVSTIVPYSVLDVIRPGQKLINADEVEYRE